MSEFDDFDLGRRLRDAAGSDPDLTAARDMVQRRVVRARRRRASAISGAAAAVLVTIGLVAAVGNEGDTRIETSESVSSVSEIVPAPTTVVASSTTSAPTAPTAPGTTTLPSAPATVAPTVAPTLPPTQTPTSLPGQSPTEPTTTSDTTPTSTSVDTGTTVPGPADITQPFDSIGGSIVVRLSGGQMTLLSTSPSAGYGIERQIEKPDDIEVRFQSVDAESRIRVRLVNGLMVADIDEQ